MKKAVMSLTCCLIAAFSVVVVWCVTRDDIGPADTTDTAFEYADAATYDIVVAGAGVEIRIISREHHMNDWDHYTPCKFYNGKMPEEFTLLCVGMTLEVTDYYNGKADCVTDEMDGMGTIVNCAVKPPETIREGWVEFENSGVRVENR